MRRRIERVLFALLAVAAAVLSGCASMGVQPWERELLAQPGMSFEEDGVMGALDDHIYFSKEASSGGASFGGGGCGCN